MQGLFHHLEVIALLLSSCHDKFLRFSFCRCQMFSFLSLAFPVVCYYCLLFKTTCQIVVTNIIVTQLTITDDFSFKYHKNSNCNALY